MILFGLGLVIRLLGQGLLFGVALVCAPMGIATLGESRAEFPYRSGHSRRRRAAHLLARTVRLAALDFLVAGNPAFHSSTVVETVAITCSVPRTPVWRGQWRLPCL